MMSYLRLAILTKMFNDVWSEIPAKPVLPYFTKGGQDTAWNLKSLPSVYAKVLTD